MRISMTRALWLLMSIVVLHSCNDETIEPVFYGNLEGFIRHSESEEPLAQVKVSTSPLSVSVLTDHRGYYRIDSLEAKEYSVFATKDGYGAETVKVNLSRNATISQNIFLDPFIPDNEVAIYEPVSPIPPNDSTGLDLVVVLGWSTLNAIAENDSIIYDINIYASEGSAEDKRIIDFPDTTLAITGLRYSTTYYWQVTSKNLEGQKINGPVWKFTTQDFPDNRLFFALKDDDPDGRGENYNIYSGSQEDSIIVRLTKDVGMDIAPSLSFKRDKVAFVSDRNNNEPHIFTMDPDGKNPFQVTTLPVTGYHNPGVGYCWSPDGGRLLYSHYDRLYKIDRNGTNLELVATAPEGRHFRRCDWTAQQNKIVVETVGVNGFDSEIYLMNDDGSEMTLLVENVPGRVGDPSFSIDGKSILYTYDVSEFESQDNRQLDTHIFLMAIDSSSVEDLSQNNKDNGTNDLMPIFSPDGANIIFYNVPNDGIGEPSVWIMDSSGGNRELVYEGALTPHWK
ncbi:carboxypeptidase regulatory-like domain-containing protein [Xanthovirga aplysinae]|uniref:carboxypeptidase regulatory-like domain-containing protein n=1 Tax=Xanthovirga aplysinae TaxID=2529853 RepID=UPI0012BBF26A|nr:carboxypeptidase regulatory-like domain-containing protein [Xanthovirga aplysinae]MTI30732.1 hypothetical protein [Xanthovirga aplysinae]